MTYWVPMVAVLAVGVAAWRLPVSAPRWNWVAIGYVVAVVVIVSELTWWGRMFTLRPWSAAFGLPLQLCDLTAWVAAAALLLRRYHGRLAALTWFWGMGGGIPALFLPITGGGWPSWWYVEFYLLHGGLIVAAILLVRAHRLRISRAMLRWVLWTTAGLGVVVGLVDLVTRGDYLYLHGVPAIAGPLILRIAIWPWYVPLLVGVAGLVVLLLSIPVRDREEDDEETREPNLGAGPSTV